VPFSNTANAFSSCAIASQFRGGRKKPDYQISPGQEISERSNSRAQGGNSARCKIQKDSTLSDIRYSDIVENPAIGISDGKSIPRGCSRVTQLRGRIVDSFSLVLPRFPVINPRSGREFAIRAKERVAKGGRKKDEGADRRSGCQRIRVSRNCEGQV